MLDLTQYAVMQCAPVKLYDGRVYDCRQLSAAGYMLVERIGRGDDTVTVAELVDVVADVLPSAPRKEIERLNAPQLVKVLEVSAQPAKALEQAVTEDAEKNGDSGAVKPTPRQKVKR